MPKDKMIEALARMWIECDPNRQGAEAGSGYHPDDPLKEGDMKGQPHWKWFVPRAEATLEYLKSKGLEIRASN